MTCTKEENLTYDANIHNNEYKYTNMELILSSYRAFVELMWGLCGAYTAHMELIWSSY